MILYSYTNMYLEGIHAGIQTAHMINEMWIKYASSTNPFYPSRTEKLMDWAKNGKTIFIYTGGYSSSLEDRLAEFSKFSHRYDLPYAYFKESKEALNGALTCIGIIAPDVSCNASCFADDLGAEFRGLLTSCQRAR